MSDFNTLQVGDYVYDINNPIVVGIVSLKLKTKLFVHFMAGVTIPFKVEYSKSYCQFLKKI